MTTPAGAGFTNPMGGLPGGGAFGVGVGVGGGVGLPAGVQLPNAGTGGAASPSTSISFLIILSVLSAVVGVVAAMFGHQREHENDGISVVSVPVFWV